ncbi:hypothetical protein WA158_007423 [Blastocystis sp. Blastoise]
MRFSVKLFFCFAIICSVTFAQEATEPSNIVELTKDNFDEVINNNDAVFVEFYSEECPACRKFLPTWEAFATKGKTEIPQMVVAKLEGNANLEIVQKYGITHTPTLFWFVKDPMTPMNYNGARSLESLLYFTKIQLHFEDAGSPAVTITDANEAMKFAFWRGTPDSSIAPSITGFFPTKNCEEYKVFIQYVADLGDFRIAEVFDTEIMEIFDMPTDKPSLMFYRDFDEHQTNYISDNWTEEGITKFFEPYMIPTVVRATHDTLKKYFRKEGKYVQVMVPPEYVKKTWDDLRITLFENAMLPLIEKKVIERGEFTIICSDGIEYKNWLSRNNLNPNKIPQMFLVTAGSKDAFYYPGDMETYDEIALALMKFIEDYKVGLAYPVPSEPYPVEAEPSETETPAENNANVEL